MNIQDIHFQDKFTIIIKKSYHFDNFSYEFKKIFFLKVLIKLELKKIFKKLKKNSKKVLTNFRFGTIIINVLRRETEQHAGVVQWQNLSLPS